MSKRPKIVSRHEKRVERQIQSQRRERDRAARERRSTPGRTVPEPEILSVSRGPVEGKLKPTVRRWIEQESIEQSSHYRRISRQMERLEPDRRNWVKEFFARITGSRGFSVHAGTRRTIPKKEIPRRPRRPWRVVW